MGNSAVSTGPKRPISRYRREVLPFLDRLVADDRAQPRHPRVAVVARVPDEGKTAARSQHARDLGKRDGVVEPMEGLRAGDDVGEGIRQRDHLRIAEDRARPRSLRGKKLQHLGQRLDRGDPVSERNETPRQLSRSGAEVDYVPRLVADEPAHRFVRVSRPSPLVGVRDTCERRRRPATGLISVDDHAARV